MFYPFVYLHGEEIAERKRSQSKLTKSPLLNLDEPFEKVSIRMIERIVGDKSHPLEKQKGASMMRNGRYVYLRTNRERYRSSFLPTAIKLLTLLK